MSRWNGETWAKIFKRDHLIILREKFLIQIRIVQYMILHLSVNFVLAASLTVKNAAVVNTITQLQEGHCDSNKWSELGLELYQDFELLRFKNFLIRKTTQNLLKVLKCTKGRRNRLYHRWWNACYIIPKIWSW